MARLSSHGNELLRLEFAAYRTAIMSDGQILRDTGAGWKLYKRLKPGIDPREYAAKRKDEYAARPAIAHEFIRAMKDAVPIRLRWKLFTAIELMPNDPDGVWAEFDSPFEANPLSVDECNRLCILYRALPKKEEPRETQ